MIFHFTHRKTEKVLSDLDKVIQETADSVLVRNCPSGSLK